MFHWPEGLTLAKKPYLDKKWAPFFNETNIQAFNVVQHLTFLKAMKTISKFKPTTNPH